VDTVVVPGARVLVITNTQKTINAAGAEAKALVRRAMEKAGNIWIRSNSDY